MKRYRTADGREIVGEMTERQIENLGAVPVPVIEDAPYVRSAFTDAIDAAYRDPAFLAAVNMNALNTR
jgi:hypothetical protein